MNSDGTELASELLPPPTPNDPSSFSAIETNSQEMIQSPTPAQSQTEVPLDVVKYPYLEREFHVGLFGVPTTATPGTKLFYMSPFDAWRRLTDVWNVLTRYNTIRWKKCKLRILINGVSSSLFGAMRALVHTYAVGPWKSNALQFDNFRMSTIPNVVIPYSGQDSHHFEIPWLFHRSFLNTNEPFIISNGKHDTFPTWFMAVVEHRLANMAGEAINLQVDVYAQFEGVELYDPVISDLSLPSVVLPSSQDNCPTYSFDTFVARSGPKKEAEEKTEKGTVSSLLNTVSTVSRAVSSVDPTGVSGLIGGVSEALSGITQEFGLDKPTSLDFASYTSLRLGDHLLSTKGMDPSLVLNVEPDATDPIDPSILGEDKNCGALITRASAMSLLKTSTVDLTATAMKNIMSIPVTPGIKVTAGDHATFANNLSFVSSFFTFWRGDIKYRLRYSANIFTDIQFYFLLTPFEVVGNPTPEQCNRVRFSVIKVKGTGTIEFTIPYHNMREWSSVFGTDQYDVLWLTIGMYQVPRCQGKQVLLDLSLECAASEESGRFEWCEPSHFAPSFANGKSLFSAVTRPLGKIEGGAMVPIKSFIELFKRYSQGVPINDPWVLTFGVSQYDPLYLWLSTYTIYRGSVRVSLYLAEGCQGVARIILTNNYNQPSSSESTNLPGVVVRYEDYNPELAVEFHYMTDIKYFYTALAGWPYPQLDLSDILSKGTPTEYQTFVALGDDFMVGCAKPLPHLY